MSMHVEWAWETRGLVGAAGALTGPGVERAAAGPGVAEALVAGTDGSGVLPHKGRTWTEGGGVKRGRSGGVGCPITNGKDRDEGG